MYVTTKINIIKTAPKTIREVKLTVDGREFHTLITRSVKNCLRFFFDFKSELRRNEFLLKYNVKIDV